MNRDEFRTQLTERTEPFDLIVIGGGATGVGVALDAAVRGLSVLLLEQSDFGKGTSSRSTKLIHGGVRYLQQGDIAMVRDSLRERARLQSNAPHLVHPMPFLVPCQSLWQRMTMRIGLWLYDRLAGRSNFARAKGFSARGAHAIATTVRTDRMRWGGVVYQDGQFDDTRLLIHMAMTAAEQGATLLNYCRVTGLRTDAQERICGVDVLDEETGVSHAVSANCVINATGPFCDAVREMDNPSSSPIIAPSQGIHLVLPREFYPGDTALIVPKTTDGRVLFLIPWHDHIVVGTTDTPIDRSVLEPAAQEQEIEFLLATLADYLTRVPTREDVLSLFAGIRPLVRPDAGSGDGGSGDGGSGDGGSGDGGSGDGGSETKSLSRDHTIMVSAKGLITITGGKWTTVRKMGEDCVDRASELAGLPLNDRNTTQLKLHGAIDSPTSTVYGTDEEKISQIIADTPELGVQLHPDLPIRAAEVVWATRHEMARTVEDILARRTRAMFLNIRAARVMAPAVATLMAQELGRDAQWQTNQIAEFEKTAKRFGEFAAPSDTPFGTPQP